MWGKARQTEALFKGFLAGVKSVPFSQYSILVNSLAEEVICAVIIEMRVFLRLGKMGSSALFPGLFRD